MTKHVFPVNLAQIRSALPGIFGFTNKKTKQKQLEMWANAQCDGRPANVGGALCSTLQSLADAHYYSAVQ